MYLVPGVPKTDSGSLRPGSLMTDCADGDWIWTDSQEGEGESLLLGPPGSYLPGTKTNHAGYSYSYINGCERNCQQLYACV